MALYHFLPPRYSYFFVFNIEESNPWYLVLYARIWKCQIRTTNSSAQRVENCTDKRAGYALVSWASDVSQAVAAILIGKSSVLCIAMDDDSVDKPLLQLPRLENVQLYVTLRAIDRGD